MKPFILFFLASSIFFSAVAQNETAKKMFTEKTLPSLVLSDIHGDKINMTKYAENNKITVVSFWATWCTPCKKELSNISYMYEDWQDLYDMELVAVSIDDERNTAKVKVYVDGQAWDYDVLLDSNSELKRMLNFQTVPHTVVLDTEGKVVYTHSGYVEGDEYILEEKLAELAGM